MEKTFIASLIIILLASCGGSQSSSGTDESAEPTTETSTSVEKKSDGNVLHRVEQIYQDVLASYQRIDEEENDENQIIKSPEEKYCSSDWNKVSEEVAEYDTTQHPEEIGFFEADYWIMGQDFDNPTASDFKLVEQKGDRAVVEFVMHNFKPIHVRLEMVHERGDWYIDNFIDLDFEFNWKKEMNDYLKQ